MQAFSLLLITTMVNGYGQNCILATDTKHKPPKAIQEQGTGSMFDDARLVKTKLALMCLL
jgi:hypothetical protein